MPDPTSQLTRYELLRTMDADGDTTEMVALGVGDWVRYSDAAKLEERCRELEAALKDALDEWGYAAEYKGDYLKKKHGDAELIATFRALLSGGNPEPRDRRETE